MVQVVIFRVKMEAARFSETLVSNRITTQCHDPENLELYPVNFLTGGTFTSL
jgi:hypothetical protein